MFKKKRKKFQFLIGWAVESLGGWGRYWFHVLCSKKMSLGMHKENK